MDHLIPAFTLRIAIDLRVAAREKWEESESVGMVGEHEKVQRLHQSSLSTGSGDLLPQCDTLCIPERQATPAFIEKVQMGIAPIKAVREVPIRLNNSASWERFLEALVLLGVSCAATIRARRRTEATNGPNKKVNLCLSFHATW